LSTVTVSALEVGSCTWTGDAKTVVRLVARTVGAAFKVRVRGIPHVPRFPIVQGHGQMPALVLEGAHRAIGELQQDALGWERPLVVGESEPFRRDVVDAGDAAHAGIIADARWIEGTVVAASRVRRPPAAREGVGRRTVGCERSGIRRRPGASPTMSPWQGRVAWPERDERIPESTPECAAPSDARTRVVAARTHPRPPAGGSRWPWWGAAVRRWSGWPRTSKADQRVALKFVRPAGLVDRPCALGSGNCVSGLQLQHPNLIQTLDVIEAGDELDRGARMGMVAAAWPAVLAFEGPPGAGAALRSGAVQALRGAGLSARPAHRPSGRQAIQSPAG
jgi:hypothetical protein